MVRRRPPFLRGNFPKQFLVVLRPQCHVPDGFSLGYGCHDQDQYDGPCWIETPLRNPWIIKIPERGFRGIG